MSSRRGQRRAFTPQQRVALVSLGVLVSAACSFSTDGITFVPDHEFDALGGGTSRSGSAGQGAGGEHSGGKSTGGAPSAGSSADAGSDSGGEAGEDTSGGSAGLGAAGTVGTAGHGVAGKGGSLNVAGSGMGGSVGIAGRPNTAGTGGVGGRPNTGGTGGTAGAGPVATVYPCTGETPGDKLIADFKGITRLGQQWKGGSMGNTLFSVFGFPDPGNGKPNVKLGTDDLTVEASSVLQPVGAGIRIAPCINLKGAASIGFTIYGSSKSGDAPMIAMRIYTNQNLPANDTTREGLCVPPSGQDPTMFCQPAHVDFALPTMRTPLEFKFADFKGGKPSDTLQLDQIKMIDWAFTSGSGQKPYDAYFTLDDVLLYY